MLVGESRLALIEGDGFYGDLFRMTEYFMPCARSRGGTCGPIYFRSEAIGMKRLALLATVAVLSVLAAQANAAFVTLGFECITNNNPVNAATGEAQFFVDVISGKNDRVEFLFRNSGPIQSVISEVYFDDNATLKKIVDIVNEPGVKFAKGAHPGNLPGGHGIDPRFDVTPGLLAEAVNPAPHRGVNPGEEVGLLFSLRHGRTFEDVLDAIESGDLRVGIHAVAFGGSQKDLLCCCCGSGDRDCNGGSESFVNWSGPQPPDVPEPATLALLSLGLVVARWQRRPQ
jgi:hypothetical protein